MAVILPVRMHHRRQFFAHLSALCVPSVLAGCSHTRGSQSATSSGAQPNEQSWSALTAEYENLMQEHGLHEWSRYAGVDTSSAQEAAQRMGALRDRERHVIEQLAARSKNQNGVSPREAELWQRAGIGQLIFGDKKATELADSLEQVINDFSFEISGKKVTRGELSKMARSDDPQARKAQRSAYVPLHRAAAPIATALLKRRQQLAREHNLAGGFFDTLLKLRGVEPQWLDQTFDALEKATRQRYFSLLGDAQKAAGLSSISAADLSFALRKLGDVPDERFAADRAIDTARAIWGAFGVNFDQPKIRIDVRDFAFAGQTISIRVPNDVRAVINPSPGARFYGTLLHELGHAFAATRTTVTEPVFKSYEWIPGLAEPAYDEGVAEVFGRLLDEPTVLEKFLGFSGAETETFLRARRRGDLSATRSRLYQVKFEQLAMTNPDQDLDALERRLSQEILGIEVPRDEPLWAISPFLATYPVYIQSYTLAAMFSCQIRAALRKKFGTNWVGAAAGEVLTRDVVASAMSSSMNEKLQRVTGQTLSIDAYAEWLSGG